MSLFGLLPSDVGINIAIAICVIAFVSGTARGFSGSRRLKVYPSCQTVPVTFQSGQFPNLKTIL